jgi:hypothetical protein
MPSPALEEQGDVDGAIQRFKEAVGADAKNLERIVALGDLYARHVAHDPQNLGYARQTWEFALGVRPRVQARARTAARVPLGVHDQALVAPGDVQRVREAANRILNVDPAHAQAKARLHIATIRQRTPTSRRSRPTSRRASRRCAS